MKGKEKNVEVYKKDFIKFIEKHGRIKNDGLCIFGWDYNGVQWY